MFFIGSQPSRRQYITSSNFSKTNIFQSPVEEGFSVDVLRYFSFWISPKVEILKKDGMKRSCVRKFASRDGSKNFNCLAKKSSEEGRKLLHS
ncbi:hypothetical protein TNCV_630271 [Trichonephila clavipes]|nr:hypothetical protein TNCV_630271 [Trichonephila clavipes]